MFLRWEFRVVDSFDAGHLPEQVDQLLFRIYPCSGTLVAFQGRSSLISKRFFA